MSDAELGLDSSLSFVENFYRGSIKDIAEWADTVHCRSDLFEAFRELRLSEFCSVFDAQFPPGYAEGLTLPEASPGTLRAGFVGRDIGKIHTDASSTENFTSHVKAALCYSHEVVLRDPFDVKVKRVALQEDCPGWLVNIQPVRCG